MHYRLMRGCLESDPEWHDGEIVGQLPGDWLLRTKETEWGRHEG
jgi:hypothetical protein